MRKLFVVLALVGIIASAAAQKIDKAGLYDNKGNAILCEKSPIVVSATIRVTTEHFTPGVYARYAQKYLGKRATLSEYTISEIVDGDLAFGEAQKLPVKVEYEDAVTPLPINKISTAVQTTEEQAASTAEMIFSLRKHRLDLITGEAGEHVFGAGLKAALDEIARIEKECLDMFYGTKSYSESLHSFSVVIDSTKSEYMVCRFSDNEGVVAADNLAGKPVIIKIETEPHKDYDILKSLGPKDKTSAEYLVVPQSKILLVSETQMLDSVDFVSEMYGKKVVALPIKTKN